MQTDLFILKDKEYSFQLTESGRTLSMTVKQLKSHEKFSKEEIISVDSHIGMDAKNYWNRYSDNELPFPECKQSCKLWDLFQDEADCRRVCAGKFQQNNLVVK